MGRNFHPHMLGAVGDGQNAGLARDGPYGRILKS